MADSPGDLLPGPRILLGLQAPATIRQRFFGEAAVNRRGELLSAK
jgi:hypothetical protein